jgi:hypothetical protein
MVRQAHHDRLDLPLVPSIKLRTGSELVEGFAPFKTLNSEMQPGQNCRYSTEFAGALTGDVVMIG